MAAVPTGLAVTRPRGEVDLRASFVLCACILDGAVLVIVGLLVSTALAVIGTLMIAFGPLGVAVRNALAPPRRPRRR
jgi:hypothetical protein